VPNLAGNQVTWPSLARNPEVEPKSKGGSVWQAKNEAGNHDTASNRFDKFQRPSASSFWSRIKRRWHTAGNRCCRAVAPMKSEPWDAIATAEPLEASPMQWQILAHCSHGCCSKEFAHVNEPVLAQCGTAPDRLHTCHRPTAATPLANLVRWQLLERKTANTNKHQHFDSIECTSTY